MPWLPCDIPLDEEEELPWLMDGEELCVPCVSVWGVDWATAAAALKSTLMPTASNARFMLHSPELNL